MNATAQRQSAIDRKSIAAESVNRKYFPNKGPDGAVQHKKIKEQAITAQAVGSPMSEEVTVCGRASVEGSSKTPELILTIQSDCTASTPQEPAGAGAKDCQDVAKGSKQVHVVQHGPDSITVPKSVPVDDVTEGVFDSIEEEFDGLILTTKQKNKIVTNVQELINNRAKAKEKIIEGYSLFANAWFEENEYGYRGQDSQNALAEMQEYLNNELPHMLKRHSGRAANDWRLYIWSAIAGCAGLLPYGKPVVSAIARLRTKQIISEQFAIARIKTEKAIAKEEAKAQEERKSNREEKQEQAATVAMWLANQAASQAANQAEGIGVNMVNEAVSSGFDASAQEVAKAAVNDQFTTFFSDLGSEMFFGSAQEVLHLLPILGQVYSAFTGYRNTRKQCRQDIQDAVQTALTEHGGTVIPDTITHMNGELEKRGRRSDVKINRLPSCAACFLGQAEAGDKHCVYCITHNEATHASLLKKFRRCKSGHDKRIPGQKTGKIESLFKSRRFAPAHAHHKAWCTKGLLSKSQDPAAWECIPCFLTYGEHKPRKCLLKHKKECEYCGVKGHHPGGCGMRFFHAVNLIQQCQSAGVRHEVKSKVLAVRHKRVEWVQVDREGLRKKPVWSKINSHVAVIGENFGPKETYERSCTKGKNFSDVGSLMR